MASARGVTPGLGRSMGERGHGVPLLVRFVTLALVCGGLFGGVTNGLLMPGFWPWPLPALVARFLAAAAMAYVAGGLVAFTSRRWPPSELLMVTVVVYGAPLVAAVLLDADLVDWSQLVAWSFMGIVAVAMTIAAVSVWQGWGGPDGTADRAAWPRALRMYLVGLGVVALVVGARVYVVPREWAFLWPWSALPAWKALDSRLVASMLLTVGAGALLAWWRADKDALRVFLAMLTAYVVVSSIGLAIHAAATPAFITANTIYVTLFLTLGGAGLWLSRTVVGPIDGAMRRTRRPDEARERGSSRDPADRG